MSLANLGTGSVLPMQYNPAEFDEEIAVVWQRLSILGQSHTQLQYTRTENHAPSFTLSFDSLSQPPGPTPYDIQQAKRWLMSCCYGPRNAGDIPSSGPPDVLAVWPNFLSMRVKFAKVKIKTTGWATDGTPIRFTAALEIEEARDVRLYGDDVLQYGTIRPDMGAIANQNPGNAGGS